MRAVLAIFAAYITGYCMGQYVEIVDDKKTLYNVGDNVTIKCLVKQDKMLRPGWFLSWDKLYNQRGKMVNLAINKLLNPEVDAATPGHFEIKAKYEIIGDKDIPQFSLTVTDLRYEDTGIYQCSINDLRAEKEITVKKLPEAMSMEVDLGQGNQPIATDAQTFTVEKGTELTIVCTSTGGNPTSSIAIKADGNIITSLGTEDVKLVQGNPSYQELVTYAISETAMVTVDEHSDGTIYSCENADNDGEVIFDKQFSVKLKVEDNEGAGGGVTEGASSLSACVMVLAAAFVLLQFLNH